MQHSSAYLRCWVTRPTTKENQSLSQALQSLKPRVFSTSENGEQPLFSTNISCRNIVVFFQILSGVHHRKANCASDTTTLRKAETSLASARKSNTLFPSTLRVKNMLSSRSLRLKKGNGGWGDPRDRELCLSLTVFDEQVRHHTKVRYKSRYVDNETIWVQRENLWLLIDLSVYYLM